MVADRHRGSGRDPDIDGALGADPADGVVQSRRPSGADRHAGDRSRPTAPVAGARTGPLGFTPHHTDRHSRSLPRGRSTAMSGPSTSFRGNYTDFRLQSWCMVHRVGLQPVRRRPLTRSRPAAPRSVSPVAPDDRVPDDRSPGPHAPRRGHPHPGRGPDGFADRATAVHLAFSLSKLMGNLGCLCWSRGRSADHESH